MRARHARQAAAHAEAASSWVRRAARARAAPLGSARPQRKQHASSKQSSARANSQRVVAALGVLAPCVAAVRLDARAVCEWGQGSEGRRAWREARGAAARAPVRQSASPLCLSARARAHSARCCWQCLLRRRRTRVLGPGGRDHGAHGRQRHERRHDKGAKRRRVQAPRHAPPPPRKLHPRGGVHGELQGGWRRGGGAVGAARAGHALGDAQPARARGGGGEKEAKKRAPPRNRPSLKTRTSAALR